MNNQKNPHILNITYNTKHTLLQLNHTLPNAQLYNINLNPFYIQKTHHTLTKIPKINLLIENTKKLPFQNKTFDNTTSTFLFHKLPKTIKHHIIQETTHILKPNNIFIILNSTQLSNNSKLNTFLTTFHKLYHKPYFKNYLNNNLNQILTKNKFTIKNNKPQLFSKQIITIKN